MLVLWINFIRDAYLLVIIDSFRPFPTGVDYVIRYSFWITAWGMSST